MTAWEEEGYGILLVHVCELKHEFFYLKATVRSTYKISTAYVFLFEYFGTNVRTLLVSLLPNQRSCSILFINSITLNYGI